MPSIAVTIAVKVLSRPWFSIGSSGVPGLMRPSGTSRVRSSQHEMLPCGVKTSADVKPGAGTKRFSAQYPSRIPAAMPMRVRTPNARKSQDAQAHEMPMRPSTLPKRNGVPMKKRSYSIPSRMSAAMRRSDRHAICAFVRPRSSCLAMENGKESPAMKMKSGKIVSWCVSPIHGG